MTLTKVPEASLFAIASVTSNDVSVGSAVDVSTYYSALVKIRMGRATASAFTVSLPDRQSRRTENASRSV